MISSGSELSKTVVQIVSSVAGSQDQSKAEVQAGVVGVVCKSSEIGKSIVIWLGDMRQGQDKMGRNSAIVRGALFATQLIARFRRSRWEDGHPVGEPGNVWRSQVHAKSVVFSTVVAFSGVPMDMYFRENFAEQCAQQRLLTEPFRWFSLGLFEALEAVHSKGFRMVNLFLECFAYNAQTDTVQLIQPGFGVLLEEDKPKCDQGSFKSGTGPTYMSRQSTNYYAEEGRAGSAPRSVDRKHLAALQQAAGEEEGGDSVAEINALLARPGEVEVPSKKLLGWSQGAQRGTPWGMLGAPGDKILDQDLNPYKPGRDAALDAAALRALDMHQLNVEIVSFFQPRPPGGEPLDRWKRDLMAVLNQPIPEAEIAMAAFLARDSDGFRQPAALARLSQHLVWSLHQETRVPFIAEMSSSPFLATPVYSPELEAQLESAGGIPMTIRVDALPGDGEWMAKAAERLKKAGFKRADLDKLRSNPRKGCLKNEPGKGVGFCGHGKWVEGSFGLWYVGPKRQHGIRRFSVALQDGAGDYCDGEPCRKLPLNWLIEHGLAGVFVNGDMDSKCCNLELLRECSFEHEGLIWIPMRVKIAFRDAYGAWKYDHAADKGCGRLL